MPQAHNYNVLIILCSLFDPFGARVALYRIFLFEVILIIFQAI